jgi:hypothetical protein
MFNAKGSGDGSLIKFGKSYKFYSMSPNKNEKFCSVVLNITEGKGLE